MHGDPHFSFHKSVCSLHFLQLLAKYKKTFNVRSLFFSAFSTHATRNNYDDPFLIRKQYKYIPYKLFPKQAQ
jgi:hypothetical protein